MVLTMILMTGEWYGSGNLKLSVLVGGLTPISPKCDGKCPHGKYKLTTDGSGTDGWCHKGCKDLVLLRQILNNHQVPYDRHLFYLI